MRGPATVLLLAGLLLGLAPSEGSAQAVPDTVSMTLDEVVEAAVTYGLPLLRARARNEVARRNLLEARGLFDPRFQLSFDRSGTGTDLVGLVPNTLDATETSLVAGYRGTLPISGSYDVSLFGSRLSTSPLLVGAGVAPKTYTTGLSVRYLQPVLRGFGRANASINVDLLLSAEAASRARLQRAAEALVFQAEVAYWALILAQESESVAARSLETAQQLHERNLELRDLGLAIDLDVLTSQRGVTLRETTLLEAERLTRNAAEELIFLAYGEQAAGRRIADEQLVRAVRPQLVVPDLLDVTTVESSALEVRPEVMAAREELGQAETTVDFFQNGRLPALDLSVGFDAGGIADQFRFLSFPDSGNTRSTTWSFGASFSLPQGNRDARGKLGRARALADDAQYGLTQLENSVRVEVRQALRSVEVGRERLQRALDVADLADQQYEGARERAELQLITTFQLLLYEDDLVESRLLAARAEFDMALAVAEYHLATSSVLERFGIDVVP